MSGDQLRGQNKDGATNLGDGFCDDATNSYRAAAATERHPISRLRMGSVALGLWLNSGCADDGAGSMWPALGPYSPVPAPLAPPASPEPGGFTTLRDINGNPITPSPSTSVVELKAKADAARAIGHRVRVEGDVATVNKAHQHVLVDGDFGVACLNWESRSDLAGRRVRVQGTLGTTNGEGVAGRVYALEVCKIEPTEPEGFTTHRDIDGNPIDARTGEAVVVLKTKVDAVRALGQPVRFEGEASSVDKAPQHVRIDEDFAVACLNWETRHELAGRRVRVTGTLGTTDEFMVRLSPNGIPSQGVEGRVYALEMCEAEPIDAR